MLGMGKSKPVSEQIRRLIVDCGMSCYELAKLTGVSESTLSRFKSGQRALSMKALDKLGEVLDLEIKARRNKG